MFGSTIKKNQSPKDTNKLPENATYEQQYLMQRNIQSILDEQAGVPNVGDQKSFLVYTDNKTGPGFYDPFTKYLQKGSPSARFPTVFDRAAFSEKKISGGELADLIMGHGNMVQKVNAAQHQIKEYLSNRVAAQGKQLLIKGEDEEVLLKMNHTIDAINRGRAMPSKSVKNSQSKVSIFSNGQRTDPRISPTLVRPLRQLQHLNSSPQPSCNFMSGVKRTDFVSNLGGKVQAPGPGAYQLDEEHRRVPLPVFPTEKRHIEAYAFRNEKSPFQNVTNITSPSPVHYHKVKGLVGGTEKVSRRLRELSAHGNLVIPPASPFSQFSNLNEQNSSGRGGRPRDYHQSLHGSDQQLNIDHLL